MRFERPQKISTTPSLGTATVQRALSTHLNLVPSAAAGSLFRTSRPGAAVAANSRYPIEQRHRCALADQLASGVDSALTL